MGLVATVQNELAEWGAWERDGGGAQVGCSRLAPLGRATPGATPAITDDRALVINSIVARMRFRRPQMGNVIYMYYVLNYPDRKVAERLGVSRDTARNIRTAGEAWIDHGLLMVEDAQNS